MPGLIEASVSWFGPIFVRPWAALIWAWMVDVAAPTKINASPEPPAPKFKVMGETTPAVTAPVGLMVPPVMIRPPLLRVIVVKEAMGLMF